MSSSRRLEVEDVGEITVINFINQEILDEKNIQEISAYLFSLVDELGRKKILLNLGNVEYLSSAALIKFITLNKKMGAVGGKLVLCSVNMGIQEVLDETWLSKLFNIQKDEETALTCF